MRALGQLADPAVLRVLFKSLGVTIMAFALLAGAGWFGFDALLGWAGLDDTLFAGAGDLRALASMLLVIGWLWLSWRIVAMTVIQFFAEDVVRAVEARHYPQAASAARDLPVAEQVKTGLGSAGRALLFNLTSAPATPRSAT